MKKLILLLILFLLPTIVYGTTKDDILKFVQNESKYCDADTQNLFDSYKLIYERMLNERELNEKELTSILNNLKEVIKIIKVNDICSIRDLTSDLKTKIYNILYDSAMIIFNADNSKIVYDKSTNAIKIYEDNALIEEIKINDNTLNEVGYPKVYLNLLIINSIIILLIIVLLVIFKNKKIVIVKNITYAVLISNTLMFITILLFYPSINKGFLLINMLSEEKNTVTKDYKINNNKIITYPSFGNNYARLSIPTLNITENIYYGDNEDILLKGIGSSSKSYLIGENKTTILNAHNFYLPKVDKLQVNDLIEITTYYKKYKYQVNKIEVVNANYKFTNNDENKIILYTCYPIDSLLYTNKRLLITAKYLESSAL